MMKNFRKIMSKFVYCLFIFTCIGINIPAFAQKSKSDVYIDKNGVMRWGDSKEEVHGFGVNHTVPFAHAYRNAVKKGIDPKKAIDQDVYHFARLGFDLYRVHVWDTEISDSVGNLLENEHLDAFDYLLSKLKERGINYVITPIAFWGNGWPEPNEDTPGFSDKYGKDDCLTNPGAIAAQENYLYQFLNHKNPYTNLTYKDDPGVIAFEVSNEPHHRGTPESVTEFIDKMVQSMRKTGCKKPIFYNISHSVHLAEAYFKADIDGGTFQWYPTGLGFQKELQGNFLPNVDKYEIPFDDVIQKNRGAKLVYEFDAADIGKSYIYPAMARSFREAGIQIATHFAYDPTYLAYANTEYNTHYMNLAYAPQKSLSLMIASKVFHEIPMYESHGRYPENAQFGDFHISYQEDLAEYVTDEEFIYTNDTEAEIPVVNKLVKIAGFGNSEVVRYEGLGAYFLDKIEEGVWRLEVMPDAIRVDNLFGRNSLKKTRAVIKWNEWPMMVNLPDLEEDFQVEAINDGNTYSTQISNGQFSIRPGTYLLKANGIQTEINKEDNWKNIRLNEFTAPESTIDQTYVLHEAIPELTVGESLNIKAAVVGKENPAEVQLMYYAGWRPTVVEMKRGEGYSYSANVSSDQIEPGIFRYYIVVKNGENHETYPAGLAGKPGDWDFSSDQAYETKVLQKDNPVYLFDAFRDSDYMMRTWLPGSGMTPLAEPGKAEYVVNVEKLFTPDPENEEAQEIHDYSMKFYFRDKIAGRTDDLEGKDKLVLKGRSLNEKACIMQLAFTMKDGAAYGGLITVQPEKGEFVLSISDLKQVKMVTLPRPYPTFLPYYFENEDSNPFNIKNVESLQFSIGPGIPENELVEKHGVAIESVRME